MDLARQNFLVIEDWGASPVTFAAGDRVNFRVSYTTLTQLEVVTVTFLSNLTDKGLDKIVTLLYNIVVILYKRK